MRLPPRALGLLGVTFALGALTGCMRAGTQPEAPPATGTTGQAEPDADAVAALEAKLLAAERRLTLALGEDAPAASEAYESYAEPPPGEEAEAAPPPMSPAPTVDASGPPPDASMPTATSAPSAKRAAQDDTACGEVCKALASMERAANRICRLTSASEPRCTQAQDRVRTARDRVARTGCPCATPDP